MNPPHVHDTQHDAIPERVRETVVVSGRTFYLDRPPGTDHYSVRGADEADESVPYWSELWPASRMLAKAVLREPRFKMRTECLEIGCGLGLGGIAALACGLDVTFSDRNEAATRFAADNARLNGFTNFRTARIDLRSPPLGLTVPLIIGADLLYEPRMVDPLVAFLVAILASEGVGLIADPDRIAARPFRSAVERAGLKVDVQFIRAGEPGGERYKGTLYRIFRRGPLKD